MRSSVSIRLSTSRRMAYTCGSKSGELVIWVYTPEDVEELAEYFGERVQRVTRSKPKTKGQQKG